MEDEIWGADTALGLKHSWKLKAGIGKMSFKENITSNEKRAKSEK